MPRVSIFNLRREDRENTNGLLRQYLPKSTDLSVHSAADLKAIADQINNRPRRIPGWRSPSEVLITSGAMIA